MCKRKKNPCMQKPKKSRRSRDRNNAEEVGSAERRSVGGRQEGLEGHVGSGNHKRIRGKKRGRLMFDLTRGRSHKYGVAPAEGASER